jgi:hypothetical protein
MYHFKITTESKTTYEGLSASKDDLLYLIKRKIETNKINGIVEIFNGKKKIEEYKVEGGKI